MTTWSFTIEGGDYDRAGSACRGLKELVKALGVAPDGMRRLMIAAYEAEMNVVIHARRGRLTAVVEPERVGVDISDEGPGIADIELAMTEGFSTAPPVARALGFGAGMGLPNIQRQSDGFSLESVVGQGTRLRFSVQLGRSEAVEARHNSLRVHGERCRHCARCVLVCPTGALRMRHGSVSVLAHLCIECTECIGICPEAALDLEGDEHDTEAHAEVLLAHPAALFPGSAPIAADSAARAVAASGYREVRLTTPWERALRRSLLDAERASDRPAISPACPAVVELVRTRFPALLDDIPCVAGPLEAAAAEHEDADVLPLCPAQRSALLTAGVSPARIASPLSFRRRILAGKPIPAPAPAPDPEHVASELAAVVTGMRQVLRTLDAIEDGRVRGVGAIELYACDGGCFGAAVLGAPCAALADRAFQRDPRSREPAGAAPRPVARRSPRSGYRLDGDMIQAMKKLGAIDALLRRLPGRDCGQCGAPTCHAFAEDVVLARAAEKACPFRVLPGAEGSP